MIWDLGSDQDKVLMREYYLVEKGRIPLLGLHL